MKLIHLSVILVSLCALSVSANAASTTFKPYRLIQEIKIGGDGFWDYASVDALARRLYVTHGTRVEVIALDTSALVGSIADTPGVHGVALAPALKRGFTSNGREAKVSIVDLATLNTVSQVATGQGPDAILYEPGEQQVYAFNGFARSATVFDAQSGKVLSSIALPGKPEFAVTDITAKRVYNNIEDKNLVVAIDTQDHRIVSTWPAAPCESASGMAIDVQHHRLFLGCENQLMVMMDSLTGKVLSSVPIGAGVDANAFDPATQLAFSSNGDGTVTIAHEDSPSALHVVQTLQTAVGARTMTLDPITHRIYLAAADMQGGSGPAVPPRFGPPATVPDSFKVLVYGME